MTRSIAMKKLLRRGPARWAALLTFILTSPCTDATTMGSGGLVPSLFGLTLGIHFLVAPGQPTTMITSSQSTLWCNASCTDPSDAPPEVNAGTGFNIGPGSYTYVCTKTGNNCFPASFLVNDCGGAGSIIITNNYANTHTFTSNCLAVTMSGNTMVMASPSVQEMTT